VIGDLADLLPVRPAADVRAPDEVTDSEVLAAADDVIVALVARLAEMDRHARLSSRDKKAERPARSDASPALSKVEWVRTLRRPAK
jgi:hypothetical protein